MYWNRLHFSLLRRALAGTKPTTTIHSIHNDILYLLADTILIIGLGFARCLSLTPKR